MNWQHIGNKTFKSEGELTNLKTTG